MAYSLNIYDEGWNNEMRELLKNAQYDMASYVKALTQLEKRYHENNQDSHVRKFVEQLRRRIWPENQHDFSTLNTISSKTFEDLKSNLNYEKFKKSMPTMPEQKT